MQLMRGGPVLRPKIWRSLAAHFQRPDGHRGCDDIAVYQTIHLRVDAPKKPAEGMACNGCGVCCASEPCPLGILASGRTEGACAALEWQAGAGLYRCGMIEHPAAHLPAGLRWTAPVVKRLAVRYISAGTGCDCSIAVATG